MSYLGSIPIGFRNYRGKKHLKLKSLFYSAFLIFLIFHSAHASTIFSSYPHNWDGGGWIVPGNSFAVRFDVGEDYSVDGVFLPLHLNPDGGPLFLEIQLWDNQYVDVSGNILPRPNTMLSSWLTQAIDPMPDPAPKEISAITSDPVTVIGGETYWIKFLANWSSTSDNRAILWYESLPYEGQDIQDRMIYSSSPGTVTPGNPWDGNFMAFDVQGTRVTPVPEPSTALLLGSGLIGLFGFKRKFGKK